MSTSEAVTIERVTDAFAEIFGGRPDGVWFAPGRINLIGEHTDYNGGFVLPVAVQRGAFAAARLRDDGLVQVHSLELGRTVSVELDAVRPGADLGWAAYAAGVGWGARQRELPVPGLELVVTSTVPMGAGLSSSAALSCVTAKAWSDLAGWNLEPEIIGRLGRDAENHIAGTPTGVMDQLASACGVARHALKIDTRSIAIESIPFDPRSFGSDLLVIDSHTDHAHVDGEYRARRESCDRAAKALGVAELRDVPLDDLESRLAPLPETLRRRARHVITDSARVLELVQVLRTTRDPRSIGTLFNESHTSMRDDFDITAPTVDLIQETANRAGAFGARMTGGGFGGCVIALVPAGQSEPLLHACVVAAIEGEFGQPTGFVAQAVDGAHRLV